MNIPTDSSSADNDNTSIGAVQYITSYIDCISLSLYICIYIYIYTYTHTYVYIYIYIYICLHAYIRYNRII